MYSNILFIGGIHGSGKGTICKEICKSFPFDHLSASDVLKWKDINVDEKNKKVVDIDDTQDRLILGLKNTITANKKYLLDGHFCLFDSEGNVNRVPLDTFNFIKPIVVCVVIDNPETISKRLAERDGKNYDVVVLEEMQIQEINYAKEVADNLGIPYFEITNSNIDHLKSHLLNL